MSDERTVRLLVIAGPTASGKTRLGVQRAHALGSEIVSADSRQVYRGLDIGSGKDLGEYGEVSPAVRHHLIDVADPREIYSVFHFQRDCYEILERWTRDVPLVMVGGTGLWIEAVLRGFRVPNVPENEELRARLMQRDHEALVEELRSADAALFERTDRSSKKRVVRSLEIVDHARDHRVVYSPPPPVTIRHEVVCIDTPADELKRRIDARLEARLGEGLVDEVRGLLDGGVSPDRMQQLGLEYREVTAYVLGAKTESRMIDDLRRGIHRLAKRQRTWFRGLHRRGIDVTWIEPPES